MVGIDPVTLFPNAAVDTRVNTSDYTSVFSALDDAVGLLEHHRRSDPDFIAALDTLKQARAMLAKALSQSESAPAAVELEVAA